VSRRFSPEARRPDQISVRSTPAVFLSGWSWPLPASRSGASGVMWAASSVSL